MKILSLHDPADSTITTALQHLVDLGHEVDGLKPSRFSFLTAMKLRKALDRGCYATVIAYSPEGAMAAISARQISKGCDAKIVCWIFPNFRAPKGVAADVRKGVDTWIFATERLRSLFPADLQNCRIEMPQGPVFSLGPAPSGPMRALWCGPINDNTARLIAAIEAIDRRPDDATLTICATGRAQEAMPAVRYSRGIVHPERIIWKGEDYDLAAEAEKANAIIQSSPDPTPTEASLAKSRKLIKVQGTIDE